MQTFIELTSQWRIQKIFKGELKFYQSSSVTHGPSRQSRIIFKKRRDRPWGSEELLPFAKILKGVSDIHISFK
jgi:hypothetical protein